MKISFLRSTKYEFYCRMTGLSINHILSKTDHRPWPLPAEEWKFYQEWNHAIFLHWQVDFAELRKFVPAPLEIDLFDAQPWVSVVVFAMEHIRPRYLPAFAPISNFQEINIRTYVKAEGKPGVYFLSIEASKHLSCLVAKRISQLPYRYSSINRTPGHHQSTNLEFGDALIFRYKIGAKTETKTELEEWLTERYALFQDAGNSIIGFEIHHLKWPVRKITLESFRITYPRFHKLFRDIPDRIQYSEGVQVLAWGKKDTGL